MLPTQAVKDEDMLDPVIAQQDKNVRLLGAQAAFDVAVAQGEIDDQTQQWRRNEACREMAAFELFSTRDQYTSRKSAMYAWKRLSPCDMSNWLEQVDDKVVSDMLVHMHARKDKDTLAAALLSSNLFGEVTVRRGVEAQSFPRRLCEAAVAAPPVLHVHEAAVAARPVLHVRDGSRARHGALYRQSAAA